MHTSALQAFIQVARLQSFAAAAQYLQLPSSNVSQKIQKLEQQLDTVLFQRTTRSVQLTSAGQQLLPKAQQILFLEAEMIDLVQTQQTKMQGKLRITAPAAFNRQYLGQWLIEIKQEHPSLDIELVSHNRVLDFYQQRLDFAFRVGPMPDSDLIAQPFMDIFYGIYASPELMASIDLSTITRPTDLTEYPMIANSADEKVLPWRFQVDNNSLTLKPVGGFRVDDIDSVLHAALSGLGLAYLPITMAQSAIEKGDLVPVCEPWWPKSICLYLVCIDKNQQTEKHRRMNEMLLLKRERNQFTR